MYSDNLYNIHQTRGHLHTHELQEYVSLLWRNPRLHIIWKVSLLSDSFLCVLESPCVSPVLLCRLVKGLRVAVALEVQLAVLEPKELEDRDFPRLSELTFFVLLVAVLLQSATEKHTKESTNNLHIN